MDVRIATCPDSWGVWFPSDPKQIPWARFLDEAAAAGYEWIELGPYGYLPTDPDTLRRELAARGLKVAGSLIMSDLATPESEAEALRQLNGVGAQLKAIGGRFLVIIHGMYTDLHTGAVIKPAELDAASWKAMIALVHRIAEIARRDYALSAVFHPHAETPVEYEPQIERFLADTDAKLVNLCFDTGHHAYCGGDAVAFLRKHAARIPYLHLKNVDRDLQRKVAAERITFANATALGTFCEPGKGVVDFLAFRDALKAVDFTGWATVEQDMYPCPFDKPLPIARRTRDYLRQIGIG